MSHSDGPWLPLARAADSCFYVSQQETGSHEHRYQQKTNLHINTVHQAGPDWLAIKSRFVLQLRDLKRYNKNPNVVMCSTLNGTFEKLSTNR